VREGQVNLSPDNVLHHFLGVSDQDMSAMLEGEVFGFGIALAALERGFEVARLAWQNPGKYVFHQPGEETMFDSRTGPVILKPHLVWKNDKGEFIPWTPSQDAILAKDWFIGRSGEGPGSKPLTLSPNAIGFQVSADIAASKAEVVQELETGLLDALTSAADEWKRESGAILNGDVDVRTTRRRPPAAEPIQN
jgi:hypothetical protein